MHYFISAGEASGDLHAAELMKALSNVDTDARYTFLGGDKMESAAGCPPLIHYRDMAFMGFFEVIRHLSTVLDNLKRAKRAITESRPDAVILVDYPSFNLKLAKHAHDLGIPVYYYISPKVWAWKEHRVKDFKKYVRRMYSILPFEVDFYKSRHNYDVEYVGNPSAEEVDARIPSLPSAENFCAAHGLPAGKPLLAIVPGSRIAEIKSNLPIMAEVASRHTDYLAVVAAAPGVYSSVYAALTDLSVVRDATFQLVGVADVALVTSGTATLEAALLGTPQVVCFRHNGSKLTYNMYRRLLKIPYVSLPNLIADRQVVKEMLMHLCTPDSVDSELSNILPGTSGREAMLAGYAEMRARLGERPAALTAAKSIVADLSECVN